MAVIVEPDARRTGLATAAVDELVRAARGGLAHRPQGDYRQKINSSAPGFSTSTLRLPRHTPISPEKRA